MLAYRTELEPPLTQATLGRVLDLTQGQVSRIERSPEPVRDLAKLERWAESLAVPHDLLWFRPPAHSPDAFEARESPLTLGETEAAGGSDVRRRHLLKLAGGAAFAAPLGAMDHPPAHDVLRDDRAVGWADVETIKEMTNAYRRLDNRFGGGHARAMTERYLRDDVLPVVKAGRYRAAVRGGLFNAAAELTQLAGWIASDLGENHSAKQFMTDGLTLCRAVNNHALAAEILAGMSHQAAFVGLGRNAVLLAREAQDEAARSGIRALVAECAVMEAHGHAIQLDGRETTRALVKAEQQFSSAPRGDDPAWLAYFDEAYLAAKFAHCFRALGRSREGVGFAERSLRMNESYARGRVFNLALLGTLLAEQGKVEKACAVGSEAVDLASEIRSQRTGVYLAELRRGLQPYADTAAVREYDDLVAATSRDPGHVL
jgi:transcriptional regulator with XRE-family HTH domain